MVNFKLAITCILALLLATAGVNASFAICAAARHNTQGMITMGFHLWNEDWKQSVGYGTVPPRQFTSINLEDNGWKVTPTVFLSNVADSPAGGIATLKVSQAEFKVSKTFSLPEPVCGYLGGDRFRGLFFGCYENGNRDWCSKNTAYLKGMCGTGLYMGADSVNCDPTKR